MTFKRGKGVTDRRVLEANRKYHEKTRLCSVIVPVSLQERIRENFPELLTEGKGLDGITGKTLTRLVKLLCDIVENP